ncbi:MAG: YDG domain-containing protein [Clostridiales bacterium]|jgi:hypothetical protein|nr:YDG domain-containing protein [Clostridiales bacterium]
MSESLTKKVRKAGLAALIFVFVCAFFVFAAFGGALAANSGGVDSYAVEVSGENDGVDFEEAVNKIELSSKTLDIVDSYRVNTDFNPSILESYQNAKNGGGYANTGYSEQSGYAASKSDESALWDIFYLSPDLQTAINNDRVTSITMTVYYNLYAYTWGNSDTRQHELYFHIYNSAGANVAWGDNSAVGQNGCLYSNNQGKITSSGESWTNDWYRTATVTISNANLKGSTHLYTLARVWCWANAWSGTTRAGAAAAIYDTQFSITYNTPGVNFTKSGGTSSPESQSAQPSVSAEVIKSVPTPSAISTPDQNDYYFTGWTVSDQYQYFKLSGATANVLATANFAAIPVTALQANIYTYSAAAQGPEVTATGLQGGAGVASYLYESTDGGVYSSATVKPTNAGSYKYSAVLKNAAGYEVGRLVDYEFDIQKRALQNINFTGFGAAGREYNGSATVDVTGSITGLLGSDAGSITVAQTATLSSADAGTYRVSFVISGDGLNNYSYAESVVPIVSVTISRKKIEPKITVLPKTYDGTTAAREGAEFSLSFETLADGEAMTSALYNVDGFNTKYADKNAGNRLLTVVVNLNAGIVAADGTKADNYELINNTYAQSHEILKKELTLNGVEAVSRPYDGTNIITLSGNVSGAIAGETLLVYLINSVHVSSANASDSPYLVAVELGGAGASNYYIDTTSKEAYIYKRAVTVTMTNAKNKAYDGTAAARVGVDYQLNFANAVGAFAEGGEFSVDAYYPNKNVGNGYSITVDITLLGDNVINYDLSTDKIVSAATLSIVPSGIILTKKNGAYFEKVYDGTTTARVLTDGAYVDFSLEHIYAFADISGIADGEALSGIIGFYRDATPTYSDKNVSDNLTVRLIFTAKDGNYTLVTPSLSFEAGKITPAQTARPDDIVLEYGQPLPTGFELAGIPGETVTGSAAFLALWDKTYAEYRDSGSYTVRFTPDDPNYEIIKYTLNLTIKRKQLTVALPSEPMNKFYDGTNMPLGDWLSLCVVEGLVLDEKITDLIDADSFEFQYPSAAAGAVGVSFRLKLSADDGNYAFNALGGALEYRATIDGEIKHKEINVAVQSFTTNYDGTDKSGEVALWSYIDGLIEGEEGVLGDENIIIGYIEYVDVNGATVKIKGAEAYAFKAVKAYTYYYRLTLDYSNEAMKNYVVTAAPVLTINKIEIPFEVTRSDRTLTVTSPEGYDVEYSIDGGVTWQSASVFAVSDYREYDVVVRFRGDDEINYFPLQPGVSKPHKNILVPIGLGALAAVALGLLIWLIIFVVKRAKQDDDEIDDKKIKTEKPAAKTASNAAANKTAAATKTASNGATANKTAATAKTANNGATTNKTAGSVAVINKSGNSAIIAAGKTASAAALNAAKPAGK